MSTAGLSSARLGRMHEIMAGHVERGYVPGLVTAVSRRGETHVDTIGMQAIGGSQPMRRDTLFRVSSMTKPVTAVATLILVEEGKLHLDEPVDRHLPELANRHVLTRLDAPLGETVPASRPITVRDLLTFRLGLGILFGSPDQYPILRAIAEQQLVGFGPPVSTPLDPDEWLRRLGTLPLMHQPGERWMYNTGSYILGVLIARASGQPLEEFFRQRIFEPLGMHDTGFTVPAAKLDQLAACYTVDPSSGALHPDESVDDDALTRPPAFPDGGGGLISTVDDFLAFGQMLLDKGKYGNQRILSRLAVEVMTADQLTPEQKSRSGFFPGYFDSRGWGFGVSITTRRDDISAVPGRYGWDGGYGTSWANDPTENMIGIVLTQRLQFPLLSETYQAFWSLAYAAIDD